MNSVAVIGGGITGLTAAFRLREKGIPVTLYEGSPRVGGVIQTIREGEYLAECGPNTILETSPKIAELVRDLGLEARRWYSQPSAENRYLVRGRRLVLMAASPVGFLRSPLFSWKAKLRLVAEPFIGRFPADGEEDLASFVLRRLGREFLDYAINPFVAGVYAGDPARLSVRHAFPKLHALEQKYGSLIRGQVLGARERKRRREVSKQSAKKVSFDEGLQVLTDRLGEVLGEAVELDARVTRLARAAGGWKVTARRGDAEEYREHRAVLYTGTAYQLAELELEGGNGDEFNLFGEVHYPPVTSVVLGFRRADVEHPLDGFGVLIPEVEHFHILGCIFSSSLFPRRAPDGHVGLTSYVGGVRAPELALRPAEELIELTRQDLKTLLGVKGEPTFRHCRTFTRAIPQYEVGYGRFKERLDQLEREWPGLYFAGHFRNGISLGDSIVAGHDVAGRMGAALSQNGGANEPVAPGMTEADRA